MENIIETNLKPCPFCGSKKLKIDKKSKLAGYSGIGVRIDRLTFSVRCNSCFARGGAVGGDVNQYVKDPSRLPQNITTVETLKNKAIELWNRRCNNASNEM